jgi:L-alanine-DL-glutamate epimerase-like enolase superfamily enzyme
MALANHIRLIPHAGGNNAAIHYLASFPQQSWAETTIPAPGGPQSVYTQFAEQRKMTQGPEGIYIQPSEEPGFGWDFEVV